ncbi:DNA repair protein RecO [Paracoccus sp. S-4012]|uniref:DNA repair protein RecO n=1 Tax=Paracoccus sp. S-4012 TaxID=2665648 RepID=UPI0012B09AC7|nr:DNA repair protein RecO [Paracoccus sp. S-4012]MRX49209.1 DNA repair protein RecO [Paracoccus sp. S-4012]
MEWREDGTILRRAAHGENAVILDVLTAGRGRSRGLLPGGASPRRAALAQPGARVALHWRAKGEGQLGTFAVEPVAARAGLMGSAEALAGLGAVAALLCWALPEDDPHPRLTRATEALLDAMDAETGWGADYLRWELLLLDELGFGLDLTACAVTGEGEGLAYVSPASGRAVTRAGAGEYAPRLLVLPALLGGQGGGMAEGLALTGHFLEVRLARELIGRPVPAARGRLAERLSR